MYRYSWLLIVVFVSLMNVDSALGQQRGFGPIRAGSNLDITNARISEQRVNRQTEIARLEEQFRHFETRMMLLERKSMRSQIPAITISEARAGVDFAEAQLKDTEHRFGDGEASELQVKSDRLALARAKGQLISAKAAHAESKILLELDVAYAEKRYLQATNERDQLQRFVAKGYTSSESFRYSVADFKLAEKQLLLSRLRLKTAQELSGDEDNVMDKTSSGGGSDVNAPTSEALPLPAATDAGATEASSAAPK